MAQVYPTPQVGDLDLIAATTWSLLPLSTEPGVTPEHSVAHKSKNK